MPAPSGFWWIKRHYGFTVDGPSSAKIYLASGTVAAVIHTTLSQLSYQNWMELAIGGTIFLITYLITTPLIGAVKKSDTTT